MAKFKVGDKVHVKPGNGWNPKFTYVVMGFDKTGKVRFKQDGAPDYQTGAYGAFPEDILTAANSRCVNSTRPIVQMALNRTVCNRYTSWPYRGTFRVGQEVVMNPEAAAVIHFMGPKVSKVTAVSKDGKTAVAFGGLEVSGMEACPRNEMEIADKGAFGLNSSVPAGVVGNAPYNPQVAIDSWNNNVVPAVSKLFGEIRKIVTVLEHNKNEDLTAIQRADNDAMLKRAKAGLEKVKELMNVR